MSRGENEGALRAFLWAMLTVTLWFFQSMREKRKMRLKRTIKTMNDIRLPVEKPTESGRKEKERKGVIDVEILMNSLIINITD